MEIAAFSLALLALFAGSALCGFILGGCWTLQRIASGDIKVVYPEK